MNGIQILLLIGIGLISLAFLRKTRSKGSTIVLLIIAAVAAAIFILWPDFTTRIARLLGVGRGTDFVLYISIMLFAYVIIHLFGRIRKLEQLTTELLRRDAIRSASTLPFKETNNDV